MPHGTDMIIYKQKLATELLPLINNGDGGNLQEILDILESPPEENMGDICLPCFKLAKQLRKAPPQIALDLQDKLTGKLTEYFEKTEVAGGYLNFFYNRQSYIKDVLNLASGENYGSSKIGEGKTVVIDYSSINIAKPFHIGHLSSTAIGGALCNLYKYLGYTTVGVNHLGDWGTQFGKLIYAYKAWGSKEEIEKDSINAMLKLYVKFHDEAEKDDTLNEEARKWFKRIEDKDEEALEIFSWFSKLTLKEAKRVYEILGIEFDYYTGESFYNDKIPAIIEELKAKNLLEESEGAFVVKLDEYELPPAIILKSDGTTLYATRDLAAAKYRHETFDFYKCLYVVAYQQSLHFQQVFKVEEKLGNHWDMEHIAFGMVSLADGTMSTRKGKIVLLEDVLNSAVEKTRGIIEEKNPQLENKEQVAKDVGVGAVIYSTLSQNRIKDIVFSFDKVLNFDGQTGPYVQYCHARCCAVIDKHTKNEESTDYTAIDNKEGFSLIKQIAQFGEVLLDAVDKNEPFYLTRYITNLAQAFNKYYFEHRIVTEDRQATNSRIALTTAVRDIIKRGLNLLLINAPRKM